MGRTLEGVVIACLGFPWGWSLPVAILEADAIEPITSQQIDAAVGHGRRTVDGDGRAVGIGKSIQIQFFGGLAAAQAQNVELSVNV